MYDHERNSLIRLGLVLTLSLLAILFDIAFLNGLEKFQ